MRKSRRPWDGIITQEAASSLAQRYGFKSDFDLRDRLSEALWCYQRRVEAHPDPDKAVRVLRNDLQAALKRGSLPGAGLEHALTGDRMKRLLRKQLGVLIPLAATRKLKSSEHPQTAQQRGAVRQAAREALKRKRRPGRAPKFVLRAFVRTLAAIYEDGTGKEPTSDYRRGGHYTGGCHSFIIDALVKFASVVKPGEDAWPGLHKFVHAEICYMHKHRPQGG